MLTKNFNNEIKILKNLFNDFNLKNSKKIEFLLKDKVLEWVLGDANFINSLNKDGVDPGLEAGLGIGVNFNMTSDEFFDKHCNKKYDLIFIDGLHHSDQVDRDLINALNNTVDNGVIVLHDCNPPTIEHTLIPRIQPEWNGDVYKSILKFRDNYKIHKIFTVDTDWGVGVIIKNNKSVLDSKFVDFKKGMEDWEYFNDNRNTLLNLITIDDFIDGKY